MCGIAGIVGTRLSEAELASRLAAMSAQLVHRGPDDRGTTVDLAGDCGFTHTRLSIIDLSASAHQPMVSADGRYTLIFNGEIFNFAELRNELEGQGEQFVSRSDTEVILKLYARDGRGCVQRLRGMFAFALWDRDERSCFLARDPLGIKPLYIWRKGAAFAFASEVRALLASKLDAATVSIEGLHRYLCFGSAQEPHTLIEGIESLPAGSSLLWRNGESSIDTFWELRFGDAAIGMQEAVELTSQALDESMRRHLVSDVPVGVLLSGGVDSTALLALAHRQGTAPIDTYCIAFEEHQFDEGAIARRTANYFGAHHHECIIDRKLSTVLLEEYLQAVDLPSCDGFNTFCATRFARQAGTKVLLSGLGGDELFGGYPTFSRIPRLLTLSAGTAEPFRRLAGRMAGAFPSARFQRLATYASSPGSIESAYWSVRGIFSAGESDSLVARYTGTRPGELLRQSPAPTLPETPTLLDSVSYLEITRYMRNQLLRDSDVFSMSSGLELRVPFSDRTLYDSVCALPAAIRLQPGKQLLVDAVSDLPSWVLNQPKRGFTFPLDQWFKELHKLDSFSPVKLRTWYRRWTLLTLNRFLSSNKIEGVTALPTP